MKKLMYVLLFIALFTSCTKHSYDAVSRDLYTITIVIQDSTGHLDSAYVDLATAILMQKSIFNEGDWIPVFKTPIGYIHTQDHKEKLFDTETTEFLGMPFKHKEISYEEKIYKFVKFKEPIPKYLVDAVNAYLDAVNVQQNDSVLINGEKWDIQETGPY